MHKIIDPKTMKKFWPYLRRYRRQMLAAAFFGILAGGAGVLMTWQIGAAIDRLIGAGQVDFAGLGKLLAQFAALILVTVVSQLLIQRLGNALAYRSTADLRDAAFTHLNHLPLRYYDEHSHGDILSRFTNDMDNIAIALAAVFSQVFSGMTTVVIAFVVMLVLSPVLTLVVLLATPVIFFVSYEVAKHSQQDFAAQQQITGALSGFVSEMVSNQKIVKTFHRESHNQAQFEAVNQELYHKGQKAQFSSSLTNPASRFVDHLAYVAVGFVGALLILSGSSLVTVGMIASFTLYASQFTKPFIELSGITTQIQTALAGLKRSFELLDQAPEAPDAPDALVLGATKPVQGAVAFEDVAFSYKPETPLIHDFTFACAPGETVAIVGQTGAGKSTLVNLLMGFYPIDAGRITVDGTDIRQVTRSSLRHHFGMVLQEPWLFDASLRDNLTYGRPTATNDEIYAALKETYMYEYVERLPQKLDTLVGSQGLKLSEGQKQLLTIARTMIAKPAMLILDEATSSVDTLTEQKIQAAFLAMMQGRTSFVIAHRLATIQGADHILVMDHGAIVEQGTHEALLAQNGAYTQLYQAQFAGSR
ncbi:ABC transporter ATP-binding protein [Enterococcus asini]|uniref:ABC transporter ATP-binding protein n=1 Tax=Enterococcus asini TaxID=57732 RepID=UPI0032E4EE71